MESLICAKETTQEAEGKKKPSPYERQSEKAVGIRPTVRDMDLFYYLYAYSYLDANQICRLFGLAGRPAGNKYLTHVGKLFHAGYLHRKSHPRILEPGSGSNPFVYGLWNKGAREIIRYLQEKKFNIPPARSDWKERSKVGPYHLSHCLLVSEFMVNIKLMAKTAGDLEFSDQLHVMKKQMTQYHIDEIGWRLCWKVEHETKDGRVKNSTHEPDQMFALVRTTEDGLRSARYFFLEVDCGTETQKTTIHDKLIRYRASADLQRPKRHYGIESFVVLIVTTGTEEGRVRNMWAVNKEVTGGKGWRPFLFTSERQIIQTLKASGSLLDVTWLDGRGDTVTLRKVLYG